LSNKTFYFQRKRLRTIKKVSDILTDLRSVSFNWFVFFRENDNDFGRRRRILWFRGSSNHHSDPLLIFSNWKQIFVWSDVSNYKSRRKKWRNFDQKQKFVIKKCEKNLDEKKFVRNSWTDSTVTEIINILIELEWNRTGLVDNLANANKFQGKQFNAKNSWISNKIKIREKLIKVYFLQISHHIYNGPNIITVKYNV
jgi:hypothetical protein